MEYADKPWLKYYDQGVPSTLKPYPAVPLFQSLYDSAKKFPDRPAILTSAHLPVAGRIKAELTFKQLSDQSDALAVALLNMGVKKGDRVGIVMPNCAQFVIAFYAIIKVGAIVCAANPTYPGPKMQAQFQDCGATFAFVNSLFYNTFKSIQKDTDVKKVIVSNIKEYLPATAALLFTLAKEKKDGHRVELAAGDVMFPDLIKEFAGRKPDVKVSPDDVAIFQYTGGTTGGLKAAMATHQALVCNMLQCKSFLHDADGAQEILLAAIPLFHVFGMVAVMMFAIGTGSTMLMVANARDIHEVLDVIHAYKPTLFHGVPAMYNAINNHPDVLAGKYDLRSIRSCISGSAPLPPATKRKFEELTGAKLSEGFGMSEMPTASHVNPLGGDIRAGSIGVPLPDMEMRIVSLEDSETDLPVGEIGELLMHGPQMMAGYYNLPEDTAHSLRKDKDSKVWLYTGDIARMDEEGFFYIVDRKKDMALIGGFNVYPTTVEKVLTEHPAVQEVGVAAIPHPNPDKHGQESLKAWVVLKPHSHCTEKELIDFSAKQLARYEVPTRIAFVSELPKTTVGKVKRSELRKMEADEVARQQQAAPAEARV